MKLFFSFFFWIIVVHSGMAQQYMRNLLGDSVNASTKLKSERFKSMWDGKIKGERYYDDAFSVGKINAEKVLLRYDLYADEFEFKNSPDEEQKNVEKALSKVVTFDSEEYYFLPYYYKSKKKFNVGYLCLLYDLDTLKVYRKNEVTFRPATFSPTTIEIGFPPRYIRRKLYFTQVGDQTPIQISKRQLLKKILTDSIVSKL